MNGKPSAIIAVYQLPGSNAVQAAEGVRKIMSDMKQRFPEDVDFATSLDQTLSVSEGIKEIVETLIIALVLVIFVVYLFLQDWRATLIPMLAVPVSLIGTFVLFPLFGFSINTLSMLGLVLAIGLVVDDAIVVVEGVQRHIEEGLAPRAAAQKAMDQLSGPVVGIATFDGIKPLGCDSVKMAFNAVASAMAQQNNGRTVRSSAAQPTRDGMRSAGGPPSIAQMNKDAKDFWNNQRTNGATRH